MIAAIFAPIIEAILGLFTAFVSLIAELLSPVLAPIIAPVVEAIIWVYLAFIAAFSHLIWGLVRLLGLASHARGISFVFFAVAIAATLYLLAGMALLFEGDTQNILRSAYSTHSVLAAVVGMLVATAIGSCLRNDPSPRYQKTQLPGPPTRSPWTHQMPAVAPAPTSRALFWLWAAGFWACGSTTMCWQQKRNALAQRPKPRSSWQNGLSHRNPARKTALIRRT